MTDKAQGSDAREAARLLAALRAHLRQEFVAPAAAIVGFADILLEDVEQLGLQAYRAGNRLPH